SESFARRMRTCLTTRPGPRLDTPIRRRILTATGYAERTFRPRPIPALIEAHMAVPGTTRIRLAELVAALSLATDLGTGQPLEHALRTCLLATVAGEQLGLRSSALGDVYYLALLRFVGCTADAHEEAALVGGDEIAFRA